MNRIVACLFSASVLLIVQSWKDQAKAIQDQVHKLRGLPDAERAKVTKQLAMQIRQLPSAASKAGLAAELANFATEGDFGRDTLQARPHWHRAWQRNLADQMRTFPWHGWCVTNTCKSSSIARSSKPPWPNWKVMTKLASAPISR